MHPVERMRSVVRAFPNHTSCVYVEPVKRTTYVVPKRNGKFFLAPTVRVGSTRRLMSCHCKRIHHHSNISWTLCIRGESQVASVIE